MPTLRALTPTTACRTLALLLGGLWAAGGLHAQQLRPEASPAVRCLTLDAAAPTPQPVYPFEAFKDGQPGVVLVELAFAAPDAAPVMTTLQRVGDPAFETAVARHVQHLRVPCQKPGDPPARLRQAYHFQSDRPVVHVMPPSDAGDLTAEQHVCLTGLQLDYPARAREIGERGRVLVRARFDAPDRPPRYTVMADPATPWLRRALEEHFEQVRLPCMGSTPVALQLVYQFNFEDTGRFGFRPQLGFRQFVGLAQPDSRNRLPPRTTTMGCPFAVRLTYLQPVAANGVVELGSHDPRRQPLLEWLREMQLELGRNDRASVFADDASFEIPCYDNQPSSAKEQ